MKTLILLFSVLFTTMSFAQVPSYVPANGLVGWWPFNGNANDESGSGNNGVVNGATLTSDRNGNVNNAFNFNYNSITLLNNPQAHFSGSWSISFWYKRSGYSTGYQNYGALFTTSNQIQFNGVGIWLILNEVKMYFQTYGQNGLTLEPYAYDMNWHHVVYTFNGSTISLYIDSVLTTSGPITISQTHTSPFNIGRGFDAFGNDFSFIGDLDDYGIWDRALTQQEITNLYTSTVPPTAAVLSGDATICAGSSTNLSVAVTGGFPPYTVTVTDGINNYSATSASPVSIPVSPSVTSTYTIVSVTGGGGETGTGNSGEATVTLTAIPEEPTGLSCWQTAAFNTATCTWDVSGEQAAQPTLACYETAVFNTTTCAWVISGPQAPQKMSYQAVIRNSNDSLLVSTQVGMRISLVQGAPSGTVVFSETQTATTNANGLVSLQIGMGTAVSGTFACIDWAASPYYVKTETDLSGGTNYTIISSNELLSVPYALFSANGPTGAQGPAGPAGPAGPQGTFPPGTVAGEMNYWNGTAWVTVAPGTYGQNLTYCNGFPTWGPCPPLVIGQSYQGGIVAYILQPGDPGYDANIQHGLIAAPSDQGTAPWGCGFGGADSGTLIPGANGTAIGTGAQNTIDIMTDCSTAGIAARLCGDLVLNGYSDWYLPSKDELNQLLTNQTAIGDVTHHFYWSSSEYSTALAWWSSFDFNIGPQWKSFIGYVRAVRSF